MFIDGKLYYGIDENRKAEIFPESPTTFVMQGAQVQVRFLFDDKGEIVSMVSSTVGKSKKGIKR
jgi:hypothetical protein